MTHLTAAQIARAVRAADQTGKVGNWLNTRKPRWNAPGAGRIGGMG